ncbi:fish-egg lectin-like [Colossoma macropomum]|uniref:fish-egg lectin-like n=1 Tax=Colossoma macropomum TaxID=42526 RepID=UPI0018655BCD|nr:fish-egg lectin-like [Colossoma macropomum]
MERTAVLFVLLSFCITSLALECRVVPGRLKQIDVSNGQVFGVNSSNHIYTLYSNSWIQVPGSLKHVSVGPAGVWGVDFNNYVYKLGRGDWVFVPGLLKQVDAGGMVSPAGVNMNDDIYCLTGGQGSSWKHIPGKLKYHSCGPYSCWGVNAADNIYIMKGVTPTACGGSLNWQQISGALSMIEVSTDGKVYGVNSNGHVYRREGVSPSNAAGTVWRQVPSPQKVKHVSYDLGHLWLIGRDDSIMDCTE